MRAFLGRLFLRGWRIANRPTPTRDSPRAAADPPRTTPDRTQPHVLVVSPFSIHPVIHGAAVRISNLIRRMAGSGRVTLLVLGEGTDDPGHRDAYDPFCEQVLFHRLPVSTDPGRDPFGLLPPAALRTTHRAVTDRISALADAHEISIVQLEFAELGGHARRLDSAHTVLVEHDVGFTTQERQRALGIGNRFDAADRIGADDLDGIRQERFEIAACAASAQVHCMSVTDRDALAGRLGSARHLRIIPNGVDIGVFAPGPVEDRRGALFVGSFPHLPNLDALEDLVAAIWPEIRRQTPDATLTVAGARPPDGVLALDGRDGISVVGEVDEVAPLYRTHRVLVVPLRAGSGTRLKILEALASGLPVVSTTIGAEGLDLGDPPEVIIADTPEEISAAVSRLLEADDREIEDLGRRGRALAERLYDWDAVAADLRRAHLDLLAGNASPPPRRAVSVDSAGPDESTDVSVVVPASNDGEIGGGLLDGLAAQRIDGSVELVIIENRAGSVDRNRLPAGSRVVSIEREAPCQGVALNAGARTARGRILVFTTHNAVPAGDDWLSALVAPFDGGSPPAAVQGGITAQLVDGCPPHDPGFDRISIRWRRRYGITFSPVNAAIPREIWRRFPFPPYPSLSGLAWQRIADDHEMLILPCHAAAVRLVSGSEWRTIVRNAVDDGRGWRLIGERYTLADLGHDLFRSRPCFDADGRPAEPDSDGHRRFRRFRPLGLMIGNRLSARR